MNEHKENKNELKLTYDYCLFAVYCLIFQFLLVNTTFSRILECVIGVTVIELSKCQNLNLTAWIVPEVAAFSWSVCKAS